MHVYGRQYGTWSLRWLTTASPSSGAAAANRCPSTSSAARRSSSQAGRPPLLLLAVKQLHHLPPESFAFAVFVILCDAGVHKAGLNRLPELRQSLFLFAKLLCSSVTVGSVRFGRLSAVSAVYRFSSFCRLTHLRQTIYTSVLHNARKVFERPPGSLRVTPPLGNDTESLPDECGRAVWALPDQLRQTTCEASLSMLSVFWKFPFHHFRCTSIDLSQSGKL